MSSLLRMSFGGLALASLLTVPAAAQEKPTAHSHGDHAMTPEMEAMMKAGTPGEHHKALGRYVGDWTYTNTMWMEPGKPPTTSNGTMHAAWLMDGRYVESTYKGDFEGMPFEGRSIEGYDNTAKKFVSSWVDNMSTAIMHATGECDAAHKVCTSSGDMLDPVSGKTVTNRSVTTWTGNDSFKMEMFSKDPSGQETKMMELTAKKKS